MSGECQGRVSPECQSGECQVIPTHCSDGGHKIKVDTYLTSILLSFSESVSPSVLCFVLKLDNSLYYLRKTSSSYKDSK